VAEIEAVGLEDMVAVVADHHSQKRVGVMIVLAICIKLLAVNVVSLVKFHLSQPAKSRYIAMPVLALRERKAIAVVLAKILVTAVTESLLVADQAISQLHAQPHLLPAMMT
jgi:hypothetical protein